MTRVMDARRRIHDLLEPQGEKVSINDMIVRATATALTRHPECNAHWMGDRIRRFHRAHIGIAVAVEDGLITPVVRDAHLKGVAQIGREVKDMAARAREKRLMPDEYTGSTFSISNLGMFGIYEFTAVINPPEAGILAIGGIEQWPVPNGDDGFRFVPRMKITMSCDHRVIDGATGARFLQTLKGMLEEPVSMLV
jgi:pyruvate dehydrogenase E2 component (dihydrolipoamide acetyltransferase)